MYNSNSLIGLAILVLDIIAIVDVLKGNKDTVGKILWILAILVFPVLGLVLYYLVGKK